MRRMYKVNPFRPSPSHSATESQSFRFSVNIFSLFPSLRGPEKKKKFQRGSIPLSVAQSSKCVVRYSYYNISVFHIFYWTVL